LKSTRERRSGRRRLDIHTFFFSFFFFFFFKNLVPTQYVTIHEIYHFKKFATISYDCNTLCWNQILKKSVRMSSISLLKLDGFNHLVVLYETINKMYMMNKGVRFLTVFVIEFYGV
jgi:hypothetical protein